jgi:small subunit ribosomal protein S18
MAEYGSGAGRDDRPRGGGGGGGGGRRFYRRKKVDYFSVNKVDHVSYKDVDTLRQFLGDGAIKRARNIALLPFGGSEV